MTNSKLRQITAKLDKLTDRERFRLFLSAVGRGDEKAARDVCGTARQASYRMTAYPFRGMVDGLPVVLLSAVVDILSAGFLLCHRLTNVLYGDSAAANDDPDKSPGIERLLAMSELVLAPWQALRCFLVDDIGLPEQEIEGHIPNLETVQAVVATANFSRGLYLDSWLVYLVGVSELPAAEGTALLDQHRQEAAHRLDSLAQDALGQIRQLWESVRG